MASKNQRERMHAASRTMPLAGQSASNCCTLLLEIVTARGRTWCLSKYLHITRHCSRFNPKNQLAVHSDHFSNNFSLSRSLLDALSTVWQY